VFESLTPRRMPAWICLAAVLAAVQPDAITGAPTAPVIGTLRAVGMADVRGVRTREATLFAGDRIRSLDSPSVNVFLSGGHRIELFSKSDVTLLKEGSLTWISMSSGQVRFAASAGAPLRLDLQSLTIVAERGEAGRIASTSERLVAVAAVKGQLKVRNVQTGEAFIILPGRSAFFELQGQDPRIAGGSQAEPQQPTSPNPAQEPAIVRIPPPSSPSARPGGMSRSTKVLIIAGIGGVGGGIAALVAGKDDNVASPSSPR